MVEVSNTRNTDDTQQLRDLFAKNVNSCRHVIANDFERVLADIIDQFEHPLSMCDRRMTTLETSQLVADALSEGFSGLHPAGFEFACWLWEVAPLHVVDIPMPAYAGSDKGFRHGVLHLRRIASMLAGAYVAQQPQRTETVIELLDASIDWVDARNLVKFALVDHFERAFHEEEELLTRLADGPRSWRRLLPLGTAARIIGNHPKDSDRAFSLVRKALPFLHEESTYRAVLYVLRIAVLYGDQRSILTFFDGMRYSDVPEARRLFCESLRNPRQHWDRIPREAALALFRSWMLDAPSEMIPCLKIAIESLGHEAHALGDHTG
jgi:hypothetical protein